jgi:hypothetical protein
MNKLIETTAERTPFFPHKVRPEHPGLYERTYRTNGDVSDGQSVHYSWWHEDGYWCVYRDNPTAAANEGRQGNKSASQDNCWRGLAASAASNA